MLLTRRLARSARVSSRTLRTGDELWDWYCVGKVYPTVGQNFDQPFLVKQDKVAHIPILNDYANIYSLTGEVRRIGRHEGIDFGPGASGRVIVAAAEGYARRTDNPSGGIAVQIEHSARYKHTTADGRHFYFTVLTDYEHLASTNVTVDGRRVRRGEVIGLMGMTGFDSGDAVHLHYAVFVGATIDGHANPHLFWVDGPGKMTCFDPKKHYPKGQFLATLPIACSGAGQLPPSNGSSVSN